MPDLVFKEFASIRSAIWVDVVGAAMRVAEENSIAGLTEIIEKPLKFECWLAGEEQHSARKGKDGD
ncbi:MAG: hypothetical protein AMXMBFR84_42590 [Candidatus Hydrogenedentota bacterium]